MPEKRRGVESQQQRLQSIESSRKLVKTPDLRTSPNAPKTNQGNYFDYFVHIPSLRNKNFTFAVAKIRNMAIRFSGIILIFSILTGTFMGVFHRLHLITPAGEPYARFGALGLFIGGFLFLGYRQARHLRFLRNDVDQNNTFIIVGLTVLLASVFVANIVSHIAIGLLAFASMLHFLHTRKFYAPPKFFYFLLAYALLLFLGTAGTQKGFRFPEKILVFYVLPLAFCCFSLSKKALLKIGEMFFKTGIIFCVITILYWFYNFLHLDADFIAWITGKTGYSAQMADWGHQARPQDSWDDALTKNTAVYYPAYLFVTSWSYFYHPTANSIVVLGGLIMGFYLYHQKNVSKWDLLLYNVLCLFVIMLMQSRIGIVGFLLVTCITGLYYLKRKIKYLKIVLLACLLLVGAGLALFHDQVSDFVDDDVRAAYRRIAASYIQEHFWWGSGFDQQWLVLNAQAEKMKDTLPEIVYPHTNRPITHVHNQILGNMVQFGIWGLIALIAMLAAMARYAIKNRSYLLQTFLCFIFLFMLIEEGEYVLMLIFILFFTAINEAEKRHQNRTFNRV
jgi:O-antigen ligase